MAGLTIQSGSGTCRSPFAHKDDLTAIMQYLDDWNGYHSAKLPGVFDSLAYPISAEEMRKTEETVDSYELHQHVSQGRFPGAVGAHHGVDLTGAYLQVDAVEDLDGTHPCAEPLDPQHPLGGHWSTTTWSPSRRTS